MTRMPYPPARIADLPEPERERLTVRSDAAGLLRLAGHLAPVVILGWLIARGGPGWYLFLLPQGVLLAFLFTLQHECTHRTPFASDRLNDWVGHAVGVVLIQPFLWFRYFHFAHHRFTNDPERDPELGGLPKPESWGAFWLHLSALLYWRDKAVLLWSNATGPARTAYLPDRVLPRLRREARVLLAIYAGVAAFSLLVSPVLLWMWLVPLMLGFPVLRLYLLAEHGRCPAVASMFENTRTTFTNRLVRFFAWNMPYHAEHHAFPQVPFHRLPDLHALVRDRLAVTSDGYRGFARDYVRGFPRA